MGEADGPSKHRSTGRGMDINRYPIDLLQRFMSSDMHKFKTSTIRGGRGQEEVMEDDIELNLGLSLGGIFGVEKGTSKLKRSSSVAGSMSLVRDSIPPVTSHLVLMRSSSLPPETEEEWKKRKKVQSLRRMEAKKRRNKKQKCSPCQPTGELTFEEEKELNGNNSVQSRGMHGLVREFRITGELLIPKPEHQRSQGSLESMEGSSSGMSEIESKPIQESSSYEAQQTGEDVGSSGRITDGDADTALKLETESPNRQSYAAENRGRKDWVNAMEDMPCVFTKGDGPDGRRVEGILYKYGRGEEVRIMCVCHGNFFSPAEFVRHAGGRDFDHPLRRIVVNPSGSTFL